MVSVLPPFDYILLSVLSPPVSFLTDRSLVVDGQCNTSKTVNRGVLHVFVLSPTLFLLFINDISVLLTLLPMKLFCITPAVLREGHHSRIYTIPG